MDTTYRPALPDQEAVEREASAPQSIGTLSFGNILAAPPTKNEPEAPATPLPAPTCPDCGGVGWHKRAVPLGHPDFGVLFACRCLLERQRAQAATYAAERRQEILGRLSSELGDLAHCRLTTFDVSRPVDTPDQARSLRHALAAAQSYARAPRGWLYLYGPCGNGKSHLAAAIGHELAAVGMDVYYRSAPDMLDALHAGYRAGDYDERIEALRMVQVLILDDLGAEADTPQARAKLFQIVNARMQYDRLTVITSNRPLEDLEPRLASRIRGMAAVVPLIAGDYRSLRVRR